jgi:hypothetical protein
MKKTVTSALLAAITVLSLSAPAAQAATRNTTSAGTAGFGQTFCLFEDSNFHRGHYCIKPPRDDRYLKLSGKHWAATKRSVNNAATSVRNYTKCDVFLNDDLHYGSKVYWTKPNSEDATFRNNGFNDKASYVSFVC